MEQRSGDPARRYLYFGQMPLYLRSIDNTFFLQLGILLAHCSRRRRCWRPRTTEDGRFDVDVDGKRRVEAAILPGCMSRGILVNNDLGYY